MRRVISGADAVETIGRCRCPTCRHPPPSRDTDDIVVDVDDDPALHHAIWRCRVASAVFFTALICAMAAIDGRRNAANSVVRCVGSGVYRRRMHIEHMAMIVDDYDRAIDFYVRALRFELVEDSPSRTNDGRVKRWVVVRPPGAATGLLLAQADGDRQRQASGMQFGGRVGLFLRVEDFDEQYRHMLDRGVEFLTEPRDEPYGRIAVFVDVAGNAWDLLGPR